MCIERARGKRIQIRYRVRIDRNANADSTQTIDDAKILTGPEILATVEGDPHKIDTDFANSAELILPA